MSERPERDPDEWRDQVNEQRMLDAEAEEVQWLRTKRLKARVAELETALAELIRSMDLRTRTAREDARQDARRVLNQWGKREGGDDA
jgi:hypothetical protein